MIKQQEQAIAKICKIISPFQFVLKDLKDNNYLKLQIKQTKNKCYQHLLPEIYNSTIYYTLDSKKQGTKSRNNSMKLREQFQKGMIYLDGKPITQKYVQKQNKQYLSAQIKSQSIIQCFVQKVECLKLDLIDLSNLKCISFYFSQLKLIRIGNIHPKQMWERAHSYFQQQIEGQFIQITVQGSQNYKEEVNIYGQLTRLRDQINIKEKIINDGFAELSKNAQKYLSAESITYYGQLRDNAKLKNKGMWQTSKNMNKSILQAQEFKYKIWQQWIKQNKKLSDIKSQEQLKQLSEQLHKICKIQSKIQYNKLKIILDMIIVLYENQNSNKKNIKFLQEIVKILCNFLNNIYISISNHIDNLDFIKSLNKILISLILYHHELENHIQENKNSRAQKTIMEPEFEKIVKIIFKLCFLGNDTFHDKIFGSKKKEYNYEEFNFDSAYLSGGFSSHSQCSDYEDGEKLTKEQKKQRKIYSSHQKIRANATSLISYMFKHYAKITETYWEMCVTSNILSPQFFNHIKQLKITTEEVKMDANEKKNIIHLIRSSFGQHCLILLSIFQKNSKIRLNAISCLLNMIGNFQSKKMIAAAQRAYVQKLLVSTKSSFIPKSFIVFSGLRNALYFLLFTLYHQKNVPIIIMIFKTLCQLCNNCTLIDKMSFDQGMGLLISNYIIPVLQFEWNIIQLQQLKILCINFLSVLVNSNRRWIQIEQKYFKSKTFNINLKLIEVIKQRKMNYLNSNEDKITIEILSYFIKLSKNYFKIIFFKINQQKSIWDHLQQIFLEDIHTPQYSEFVSLIFKGYLDEVMTITEQSRKTTAASVQQEYLNRFMVIFIRSYSQQVSQANYLHLLTTITYVNYDQWDHPQFKSVKAFLIHCFYSFVGIKGQSQTSQWSYPSIENIKSQALVRVALIKLVGYMSFCPAFQSQDIARQSIKLLLEASKLYKSFNSMVKISWGLSNWVKIENFNNFLSQAQIKQCLQYLVKYSQSDKEKIASNCTRGIGFFLFNNSKKYDLKHIRKHIIHNLSHSIIKVRTNTTKTLISIHQDLTQQQIKDLLPILEQNILKNHYHLQMQTLNLLNKLKYPIKGERLFALFVCILKNLLNNTTLQYQFSQIKTIKMLRFIVLSQIFNNDLSQYVKGDKNLAKDILISIYAYLIKDCREERVNTDNANIRNIQKQFQKSEQARQLIFNNSKSKKFSQQNVISSQLIDKGFVFKANSDHLQLIQRIKTFSQQNNRDLDVEWLTFSKITIQGDFISIDFSALQLSQIHEQLKDLLQVTK